METPRLETANTFVPLGHRIGHLTTTAPEVSRRLRELMERSAVPSAEQQDTSSKLFESLAQLLRTAAMAQPLVLVLDGKTDDQSLVLFGLLGCDGSPTASRELPQNVCRKEGDYWTIATPKGTFRLKDAKGLHYIAHLLRHSGKQFHVADLAALGREESGSTEPLRSVPAGDPFGTVAPGLGDAGDVLDEHARDDYKRRLQGLRSLIDEATEHADLERATRLREEFDFITRELAAAYGLGGRSRKAADTNDRIRKAVTARIRESIAKISEHQPALGVHLSRSIATGFFCRYQPEFPVDWSL